MQQPPPYGAPYGAPMAQQPQAYAAPAQAGGVWREGALLVTNVPAVMLPHCLKCGVAAADVVPRQKQFEWVPPWAKFLYAFGRLGNIILRFIQRVVTVAIPLCNACEDRWKAAKWIQLGIILGGFVALVFLPMLVGQVLPSVGGILFGLLFLAWLVSFFLVPFLIVKPRTLAPASIEGSVLKLEGVHGAALGSLPGQ